MSLDTQVTQRSPNKRRNPAVINADDDQVDDRGSVLESQTRADRPTAPPGFALDINTLLAQVFTLAITSCNMPLTVYSGLGILVFGLAWLCINGYTYHAYECDRARSARKTSVKQELLLHVIGLLGGLPAASHYRSSTRHRLRTTRFTVVWVITVVIWGFIAGYCAHLWCQQNHQVLACLPEKCVVATLIPRLVDRNNVGAQAIAYLLKMLTYVGYFTECVNTCVSVRDGMFGPTTQQCSLVRAT